MLSNKELKILVSFDNDTIKELAQEVLRLKGAIEKHKNNTGHEVCWLNDKELWSVLDENVEYPHDTLPIKQEFLRQCERYYQSRITGTKYEEPKPKDTIGSRKHQ